MKTEIDREDDGRWIAEVPDLPGVLVYGSSREEAISKVKALALRVLADRLRHRATATKVQRATRRGRITPNTQRGLRPQRKSTRAETRRRREKADKDVL
jgi:predicted RNase H-like HicB family nuclease